MPDATARLFFALWPQPRDRAATARWLQRIAWPPGSTPVPPARLHLTLHFLGEQPRARIDALAALLRGIAPVPALVLDRVSAWGDGLVVLECSRPPPALQALHEALGEGLRGLGIAPERRRFRAHVTLARRAGTFAPEGPAAPLRWAAPATVLVESCPLPPRYRVLSSA